MRNISLKNKKFKTFSSIFWENACKSSTWCHLKFINSWVYEFITKIYDIHCGCVLFQPQCIWTMVTKSGRARGFLNPLCLLDWNVQDLFVVTSCDGKDKIECILYRRWVLFLIGEEKRKPCWNQYIRSIEPSPSVIKWRRSDIPRGDNKIHFWQFGGVNLACCC